jgi:hypothetical protein
MITHEDRATENRRELVLVNSSQELLELALLEVPSLLMALIGEPPSTEELEMALPLRMALNKLPGLSFLPSRGSENATRSLEHWLIRCLTSTNTRLSTL